MKASYPIQYSRLKAYALRNGVKFDTKANSRFMRALIVFFSLIPLADAEAFRVRFTTHIGRTVYWPDRALTSWSRLRILSHELIHDYDARRLGQLRYMLMYTFPQCLAVPAVLSILLSPVYILLCWIYPALWSPHVLWVLCLLVFAAPWPSPGRSYIELRGYAMTMWIYHYNNTKPDKERLVQHFITRNYYWMSWSETRIRKELDRYEALIDGHNLSKEIYEVAEIHKALETHTLQGTS